MTPTRVPPRTRQLKIIRWTHKDAHELSSNISNRNEKIIDTARLAMESNGMRSGELNLSTLEASLRTGALRNALKFHATKIKRAQ